MYFKQLEIVGFKSFPHKTKIKFEPGVTAVVGPNGCGKSNISDAIRWVMGEQSSKALRGSSMEDVIFNGTDAVDPINMAEVSLTLSNESRALPIDYNEVTITRRLFRSGESEYILNKTAVRLKDVQTLLMGTGMGTNSYSIIEQGKIGLILSSKPEDRRFLFEEASGITKYKAKKKEALRKLEHTENNLVRINDIITEVKRQINSIERHAKKAERYKVDFEAMKDMDIKLAVYELRNINNELEKDKKELEVISQKEESLKSELDEIITLINRHREDMDSIIMDLTDTQQKRSDAALFIDKSSHKAALNKERVEDIKKLEANKKEEKSRLEEKIATQEQEIARIKERLDEIVKAIKEKEQTQSQKEETEKRLSLEIDEHQKDIKVAKNSTVGLLAFQTKTKNELIKIGADLGNRKTRSRRLEAEKNNIIEERKKVEGALGQISSEVETSGGKVSERQRTLEELKNRLEAFSVELENIQARIKENENAANALKSKEEMLREMIKNFEGFDKGTRYVLEGVKTGALSGVVGTVADMLEPADGYETALEIALGKKAQAIVVENKDAFERALEFLGDEGLAHFIIYEDINAADYNRHEAHMRKRSITPLSAFAKIAPSHKAVADFLLDDIYVAEDRNVTREVFERFGRNIKFVTKDGFFLEKGYCLGGFMKNEDTTSIIGRTKKLKEFARQIAQLKEEADVSKITESEQKKKNELVRRELDLAGEELKKEEIELANVLAKKESVEVNLKKINDEISVVELEISEIEDLIHGISLKGEELNKGLNENESEYAKAQAFIVSSQETVQGKTKEKNELIFEISDIRSETSFLKNTEAQEIKNLEKETRLFDELKREYESKQSDSADADAKTEALLAETKELEEKGEEKKAEEKMFAERLREISERKLSVSHDLREKEKVARQKETLVEEAKDSIRTLEMKEREGELLTVNIRDRIKEAYKLDIGTVNIELDEGTNWEETKNQIEVLKIKVDKLGPVNLVAIDEHKDLEERYLFLSQQQEDLLRAKESLHKAILKINKTTKQLFLESFQKIQVEFRSYFKMLFSGGHAELLLLDETDVLESGIEIVARPPGKKLQNLLLLSGGEKALTAIALLFAIFKVKPSPFCILDEVDAPLDETNIGRFLRILQEFLKTSQFIVITHSKKTMQMADVLYGITMEKKGVSKIVSVKFAEDEKENQSEKEKVFV
ncbi:MAG: chromosome segregation protein SMC [Candidatus Omnitrophica bacterium]|nr:chromosome segregation protein SMC [Candidatus Omnitrophota bacterium]